MPGVQFLLSKAPGAPSEIFSVPIARKGLDIRIAEGSVYDALQLMEAAIIASGTATLDAALCEVPMAVVYRSSWLTYLAAKAVIRIPHIALVNVVAQRRLVPEFIQQRAQPKRIAAAVTELLRNQERTNAMKAGLREVRAKLGPPGAVERAADVVREILQGTAR
jgi:lipid-A-disaccharide synthase